MTTATHEAALAAALRRAGTPELDIVGPQSAARICDLSRARFYALWKGTTSREADPSFPAPDAITDNGPVWQASRMRAYAAGRVRPLNCHGCGKQRQMDRPNGLCATCLPGNLDPDFETGHSTLIRCTACGDHTYKPDASGLCEPCLRGEEYVQAQAPEWGHDV